MQEALESGQLDRVSELLGQIGLEEFAEESGDKGKESNGNDDDGDDKTPDDSDESGSTSSDDKI